MKSKRREFLKISGLTGVGLAASNPVEALSGIFHSQHSKTFSMVDSNNESMIGQYGPWAASLMGDKLPSLSYRKAEFKNLDDWKKLAKGRLIERLGIPTAGAPKVEVKNKLEFDGLSIEELSWQLPFGRPSEATLLKPKNPKGKLPGILAFHDHAGNKYFGKQKITKITNDQHNMMKDHQQEYYSGFAWANEIAKRGYVVLVPDAFPFESRRVWLKDVPEVIRKGLDDNDHNNPENINAYNRWASDHEHTMSKSLFCAGTTWPGVFFLEDQKALDILCSRDDVDASRVGCCGLSGGGMRTVFMAGLDERIKCAVPVGFMTTWRDFLLNKSYTHTWMVYVPILPNELDFPEILGLCVPAATLVLNDSEDQLYTLPEMKRADSILSDIFKKAKAPDRYKCSFFPGPHKFDSAMQAEAFEWFDKWLK